MGGIKQLACSAGRSTSAGITATCANKQQLCPARRRRQARRQSLFLPQLEPRTHLDVLLVGPRQLDELSLRLWLV